LQKDLQQDNQKTSTAIDKTGMLINRWVCHQLT